jgi:subtilisin family serine protease
VIAVSSIQQDGYNNFSLSYYSNWGPEVDFTAPGYGISTWIGSTYKMHGVTGQAAAHVSGVAALMLSAGKTDLVGRDVTPNPLPPEQQGLGLIDAGLTVTAE